MEHELVVCDMHGMPGVRPTLVAGHDIDALGEYVDDLPLPLVTPLAPDDDGATSRHARFSAGSRVFAEHLGRESPPRVTTWGPRTQALKKPVPGNGLGAESLRKARCGTESCQSGLEGSPFDPLPALALLSSLMRHLLITALLVLLLPLDSVSGQEIATAFVRGQSDYSEFGSPSGWSARVSLPVSQRLRLEVGRRTGDDERRFVGQTCAIYRPQPEGCVDEIISSRADLTSWQFGVLVGFPLFGPLDLAAGYFRDRSSLSATMRGEDSGVSTGDMLPPHDSVVWSTAWGAELSWTLPSSARLWTRLQIQSPSFPGCDQDPTGPFCGKERLYWLEMGIAAGL